MGEIVCNGVDAVNPRTDLAVPDVFVRLADTGVAIACTSPFDRLRHVDSDGREYWSAREIKPLMGYKNWSNFSRPLHRAEISAKIHGLDAEECFYRVTENSSVDGKGGRPREDIHLSRRACYLVALNCDPSLPEVAAAQNYFVEGTRFSEVNCNGDVLPKEILSALDKIYTVVNNLNSVNVALEARMKKVERSVDGIRKNASQPHLEPSTEYLTLTAYLKTKGLNFDRQAVASWGNRLAFYCRANHIRLGLARDPFWNLINTYPVWVIEGTYKDLSPNVCKKKVRSYRRKTTCSLIDPCFKVGS